MTDVTIIKLFEKRFKAETFSKPFELARGAWWRAHKKYANLNEIWIKWRDRRLALDSSFDELLLLADKEVKK